MREIQLSVIITTYNRKNLLIETLNQIFSPGSDFDKDKMEVIVVNDGTENLNILTELYSAYPIRVVRNRGRGLAAGRNTGVALAQGKILLFHDDDILPLSGYFQRHITVHEKYDNAICTANRIYPPNIISIAEKYPFGRYKLRYEYDWKRGMKMIPLEDGIYIAEGGAGFSCSMRKTTYLNVGPFDETFEGAGCEDSEFIHRAKKKGDYMTLFDEKNVCYHNELDNFELISWLNRQASGIKTSVVMCKLHPEGKAHPTWYTNAPLSWKDPLPVKILKIKEIILSRKPVMSALLRTVNILERINVPDPVLFGMYNALWLGATYRSFQEKYREMFGK